MPDNPASSDPDQDSNIILKLTGPKLLFIVIATALILTYAIVVYH